MEARNDDVLCYDVEDFGGMSRVEVYLKAEK